MCGISGIIGIEEIKGKELIGVMTESMKHRGPDAIASFVEGKAALGHVRLSIIDLSHGADQPFHDVSGRYVIVFNGEIYNYKEVKADLDYPWKSESDTEVILAAYIKWGKECLHRLNGMFAFAIWDRQEQSLFIARDRVGIKPLYYSLKDGVLVFASEMRSMLKTGIIERKLDRNGLCEYLSRIAVRTPHTMVEGLKQLMPGYCATFKNGKLDIENYWKIVKPIDQKQVPVDFESAKKKTLELFEQSIQRRMVADVKVGAFLSGGIDSSAVVAAMARQSPSQVETFSIIFDEKEFDESEYARMIAKKYDTKHTEIKLKPEMLIDELPGFFKDLDSPTVDGINTYLVSKLVKQTGIKVVLTGLGGDELFAGYKNFKRWKDFKTNQWLFDNIFARTAVKVIKTFYNNRAIAKIHDLQSSGASGFAGFYNNSRRIFLKKERDLMIDNPACQDRENWVDLNQNELMKFPLLSQYSVGEITNYTLDVLIKDTDQMSMAWALEVREPFFDYQLIEYVLGVPDKFKYSKETPKHLLVHALGDLLPPEIVYRPKKGFSFPWDYWLRNELKSYCQEAIEKMEKRNLFKKDALMNYWNRFLQKDSTITWTHIWSFVVLEKWMTENDISA